jgi:hypothetical protein
MTQRPWERLYVYVVYLPGNPITTVGAWESLDAAKEWTAGDHEEGNVPEGPGRKKYRLVQIPIVRINGEPTSETKEG